jgi:DNA-binding transcriptional MocR family regulator
VLPLQDPDPYHVAGDDPELAEALMTPKDAASAAELARVLRERLFRGDFDDDGLMPSRMELKRPGVSAETASVALRMLAAEGLIRIEQGKRSVVLPVHRYEVTVKVPSEPRKPVEEPVRAKAERRVRVQEDDDPAVAVSEVAPDNGWLRITLAVTAADSGRAAARAMAVTAYACPAGDGWDLAGASVTARPT